MPNNRHNRPKAEQAPVTTANLPVLIGTARVRPSLKRHTVPAHFLSQLIAERSRLAVQRSKRRASTAFAASAYQSGSRMAVRRMPAGFGHTEVA